MKSLTPLLFVLLAGVSAGSPDSKLLQLSKDFWTWRAVTQPVSGDDIPRLDRPAHWLPDWSQNAVQDRRKKLAEFEKRWGAFDSSGAPADSKIDHALIGSALSRVKWEIDILADWRRNPLFYIEQSLTSLFDLLLQPAPFTADHSREIVLRTKNMPVILQQARQNLDDMRKPFALLALAELREVNTRLNDVRRELSPLLQQSDRDQFSAAVSHAIQAFDAYAKWIEEKLPGMQAETAVGRDAYNFFLKNVALLPYSPEELLQMGKQEWERSVAFETYEKNRNRSLTQLTYFPDQQSQIKKSTEQELEVRRFLEKNDILTVPSWVAHYRNLPMPAYLQPLSHLGVTDDLTSPSRLNEDAVSYIPKPSPALSYFYRASAQDPRPLMVHEGIPGHYLQLALSWKHENPIRRHYYDSGPNEGLAFYAEEMLLQAGYFDDSPRTREIIYNFMRLRALRVEVDVKLALGSYNIEQAGSYLQHTVPMDEETAREEAAFFAASPGQAITYQIGKIQIMELLANARRARGDAFRLREFHDYLWKNGNVPISLLQLELLAD